ncbi:MAG: O-antigen ligase family protein [Elusimicrobia bacterium]|nr:O-antigen ligase family protein [Elusimicrobiota bacterium]
MAARKTKNPGVFPRDPSQPVPAALPAGLLWGQRIALAGGVLALWPGLLNPTFTPKSVVAAAGLAAAWMSVPRARKAALSAPILALLGCAAASTVFSVDPFQSFWGEARQPYYGVLELVFYALAYWLGASVDDAAAEDGLSALVFAAGLAAACAAIQAAGWVKPPWGLMSGRVLGLSGHPSFFGTIGAALLPVCLWRWKAQASRASGAAAAGLVCAILLTQSRGAWLAAAAGGGLWLAASGRIGQRERRWAAVLAVLLAAAGGVITMNRRSSDSMRPALWKAAAAGVMERPATGFGPDNYMLALRKFRTEEFVEFTRDFKTLQSSAHNDLFQAAATLGFGGLLIYLWLQAALAFEASKGLSGACRDRAAAAAGGLAAFFVASKFNPVPFEGCLLAAWLAGSCGPRAEAAGPVRRFAFSAASLAALAAFCLLAAADGALASSKRSLALGRVREAVVSASRAASLAPGRLNHEIGLCSALVQAAQAAPKDEARAFAETALGIARRAAARHPGNPQAREMTGTMLLFGGLTFDRSLLPQALAELKTASSLDRMHPYALSRQVEAARAMGDRVEEERAAAELARVSSFSNSAAGP